MSIGDGTRPARSDKEVGMSQTVAFHRVAQRADHGILTEHFLEDLRSVFAGENLVAHEKAM